MNATRTQFHLPGLGLLCLGAILVVLSAASAALAQGDPAIITESLVLTASDGDAGDVFGIAVALDGDTAAVGATGDDAVGFEAGAVYVYERDPEDPGAWLEVAKLTASDGKGGDELGAALDLSGDILLVGAPLPDATADSGAVYVFERDEGGVWSEVARLQASDRGAADQFGVSVSVEGGRAAIGSADDEMGDDAGAVYVFERNEVDGSWIEIAKLTASDAGAGDYFGLDVSLSGDWLAVGKPQGLPLGAAVGPGAVHVFEADPVDPSIWTERAILEASDGDFGNLFGFAVGLDGDYVVAGAPAEDGIGADSGAAYVFERDFGGPDAWGEIRKLSAFDGGANDSFGFQLDLEGEKAVIGSLLDDAEAPDGGSASIFVRDFNRDGKDLWRQEGKLVASDADGGDRLGTSLAWSGNEVLAGTEGAEASYLYDLSFFFEPTPSCVLFDGFCDRLNLVADFLDITGEWENWDCEGADQAVSGFPLPNGTQRVFCLDPGCPLGVDWVHVIYPGPEQWDLWRKDDGPPVQIRDRAPVTILDGACEDVLGEGGGVAVPAGRASWEGRR